MEGRYPSPVSQWYGGVRAAALPLVSMISRHDSKVNEDEDMNLQKILVYKNTWAGNMVHIILTESSCIIYKKSDCEKIFG